MYIKNTDHYVQAEHRQEYIKAMVDYARNGKKAGAKRFDVLQTLEDPNCIINLQIWKDFDSYDVYHKAAGPGLAKAVRQFLLTEKIRASEAKNLEPTDAEWDTAYEGSQPRWGKFGPVYTHNTWIYLQPDKVQEATRLLIDEVRLAKKMERGILRFDIYQNLQNPALLHTYEVYADQDAHHFHYAQEYLKEFYKVGVPLFDRTPRQGRPIECRQLEPSEFEWMAGDGAR